MTTSGVFAARSPNSNIDRREGHIPVAVAKMVEPI
jgi:hypothetical protein